MGRTPCRGAGQCVVVQVGNRDDDEGHLTTNDPLPPGRAEPGELARESVEPVDEAAGLAASSAG